MADALSLPGTHSAAVWPMFLVWFVALTALALLLQRRGGSRSQVQKGSREDDRRDGDASVF